MKTFLKFFFYNLIFFFYKIKFINSTFFYLSKIRNSTFESEVIVSSDCEIYNSYIGKFTYVSAKTKIIDCTIGKFCSIASGVKINLPSHPSRSYISTHPLFYSSKYSKYNSIHKTEYEEYLPVSIGNDVWIGENSIILSGLKIGNGSIIAAGAIVTKDVPDYAIVGGVPAKVIRMRFSTNQIRYLLSNPWWELNIEDLMKNINHFKSVNKYLEKS